MLELGIESAFPQPRAFRERKWVFKPNWGSVRKEKKMLGKALYIFLELYIAAYYRLDGRTIVCID